MAGVWIVEFYQERSGKIPVADWLKELRKGAGPQAVAKVERAIDLLKESGLSLPTEYLHKLRAPGIWELIATYQRNPYRVLFYNRRGTTLVLLVGFHKKTEAVPDAEIERAARRADDDRKRHL
jgi:phage-related protein